MSVVERNLPVSIATFGPKPSDSIRLTHALASLFALIVGICILGMATHWYMGSIAQANTPLNPRNAPIRGDKNEMSVPGLFVQSLESIRKSVNNNPMLPLFKGDKNTYKKQSTRSKTVRARHTHANNKYPNSISRYIGKTVLNANGTELGQVFDIIVEQKTGTTHALVISKNAIPSTVPLNELYLEQGALKKKNTSFISFFTNQHQQQHTANQNTPEQAVSLKSLNAGQIFDDLGLIAGKIQAVSYTPSKPKKIHFMLESHLKHKGKGEKVSFSFRHAKIIENEGQFGIMLTREQTAEIAKYLYVSRHQK